MNRLFVIILIILSLLFCWTSESVATEVQFVFVRIPERIEPLDRVAKYEDPLNAVLKKEGVGEVTGGGSLLSAPDSKGWRSIQWVGVDVDLSDFTNGIPILKRELRRIGAPPSTILEYTRNGKDIRELLK